MKMDKLGAHFKIKDMFTRLQNVIIEKQQEKRHQTLMQY